MKYFTIILGFILTAPVFASTPPRYGQPPALRAIQNVEQSSRLKQSQSTSTNNQQGLANDIKIQGDKFQRNAPSIGGLFMAPSGPCQGVKGAGGSFWLGGAAISGSHLIVPCDVKETVRVGVYLQINAPTALQAAVMYQANLEVYCQLDTTKATGLCKRVIAFAEMNDELLAGDIADQRKALGLPPTPPAELAAEKAQDSSNVGDKSFDPHAGPEREFSLSDLNPFN